MEYVDFRKVFEFTMRETGIEEARTATAHDIACGAGGEVQSFTGGF